MSKTIYYADVYSLNSKLIKQSSLIDSKYVYQKCPAFVHKNERIFVGTSPVDLDFSIERTPEGPLMQISDMSKTDYIDIDNEHIYSPQPVFQLYIPKFLFWTESDDIWIEQNDHPMTSLNNNIIAVPAWFNLSNWSRTVSVAFTIVNEHKPVIIKKGDPLFRISFYSDNLNDNFKLEEKKYRNEYKDVVENHLYQRRESDGYKTKLFSKTSKTGKCPFSFLF
tara:strand:+ start:44 stop:709 length:666 start_codon:yes stop_codon:yes gene_type:complete